MAQHNKTCQKCGELGHSKFYCRNTPRKPIAQRGKRTMQYEKWRDTIARPHLIRVYGNVCQECGRRARIIYEDDGLMREEKLDVAHIVGRGRDASMKMVLTNVRLLCRKCHRLETDGKL